MPKRIMRKQRGFTLIDTLIALAIFAVGVVIAGSSINGIFRTHAVTETAEDQNTIAETVADRLAAQSFTGKRIGIVIVRKDKIILDAKPQAGDSVHEYWATSADRGDRRTIAVSVFSRTRKISEQVTAQYPK